MTCGTHLCCLCDNALRINPPGSRDAEGRWLRRRQIVWLPRSPYYADGHLTNGVSLKGKPTMKPHREFCPGCLARMGVKLPKEVANA